MKKWRSILFAVPFWLLIAALAAMGISSALKEIGPLLSPPQQTEAATVTGSVMPENIIQIGDSFECFPNRADGHLLCTVTSVKLVTEESECPAKEDFWGEDQLWVPQDQGSPLKFSREEWFTEGGGYDRGARFVLVELTVTNVDAVSWLSDGTLTNTDGYFHHNDVFHCYSFLETADLANVEVWPDGSQVASGWRGSLIYFSKQGEYSQEELFDTPGQDTLGIQIPISKSVSFALGYALDARTDETPQDLTKLWLSAAPGRNISTEGLRNLETSVFIDTKLGENQT